MHTEFLYTTHPRSHARAVHPSIKSGEGIKIERSIAINRPAGEIYSFWRRLENLPRFLQHVQSVTQIGDGTSHWVIKAPPDQTLKWDARLIEDKPDQMISWQSLDDADVNSAGSVWFTPDGDGRGTVVKVSMKYSPRGGKIGETIARMVSDSAEKELAEDLFHLKNLLETGEAPSRK
jgi:uncharacterized membrane protein